MFLPGLWLVVALFDDSMSARWDPDRTRGWGLDGRDAARMDAFSSVYDTRRDATLAEFRKRGGKLLIFHGTADPIFSALESMSTTNA